MANIKTIQPYGNQLAVVYDDGTRQLAYPTSTGIYILAGAPKPPDPPPNSLIWPWPLAKANINMGYPEDGFHTAGRPSHEGMDWGMPPATPGTPNRAAGNGTVIVSGEYQGYGQACVIDHGTIAGHNYKTLYGHNIYGSLTKAVGASVAQKETIGSIGNTGHSFGAHLHFETWKDDTKIDPLIAMAELNPNNLDCTQ